MATGTTSPISGPAFHADDLDQTTYSSLSVLAVVGLVLGLASPFCLAGPLLMGIPIVGAAVSILALWRIASSDGALAGRWIASTGLALSVACGIGAITHTATISALRAHQAQDFGRKWIELLVAGKTEEAFQLTVDRMQPAPAMPEPGAGPKTKTPHDQFMEAPLIKALSAAGADANVRFDGTASINWKTDRNVLIQQKFTVSPKSAAQDSKPASEPIVVALGINRGRIQGQSYFRWLITNYAKAIDTKSPATAAQ